MDRRRRLVAATAVALYLVVAAILFVLVFRTTGILWWDFEIDRRIDPPPGLSPASALPAPESDRASHGGR